MGPSIQFSGSEATNVSVALNLLHRLNSYVPQIVQLVNNGVDLYTAVYRVVSTFNNQSEHKAQVEHTQPSVQPQQVAQPLIRAFWDPNYGFSAWHNGITSTSSGSGSSDLLLQRVMTCEPCTRSSNC